MEQSGVSIITSNGVMENSGGKSKSIGITLRSSSGIQAAKEKLKSPCEYTSLFVFEFFRKRKISSQYLDSEILNSGSFRCVCDCTEEYEGLRSILKSRASIWERHK